MRQSLGVDGRLWLICELWIVQEQQRYEQSYLDIDYSMSTYGIYDFSSADRILNSLTSYLLNRRQKAQKH